ncbi:hypothetical protein L596_007142 [Steinernema carpocapsae]|uniref:Dolichyl-diphosphooligosaccharide--protein glycosyltransferase 48 kDa subunit n=1 Tax=Steinernema carpocapsae TaxID=34508 RepID=A0A4U5P924_STECR|nr:hypothetical protein L596_007142 [Steinernema carpocapsae]
MLNLYLCVSLAFSSFLEVLGGMRFIACALALLCASGAFADNILVLIDDAKTEQTHSIYLKSLRDRGHLVTVKLADDASLKLFQYGEFIHQHVVILAPSVDEFGGSITVPEIVKFIDQGGNVLVTGGNNLGEAIRELALENGFEFDDANTAVIDHLNYDNALDDGTHTTIVTPASQLTSAQMIVGDKKKISPVLFKGVALVSDDSNRLKLELLTAATTAYSANPQSSIIEYPAAIGRSAILIGALQARNNARVVFTGSVEMFSDKFLNANVNKVGSSQKATKSGNLDLVTELSKWVLKEKGVLRVKSVSHHKAGETEPPREYTINEKVEYKIDIEEWSKEKGWTPFQGDDVQMAFVRIDPFVRLPLYNTNGLQKVQFELPDVYGVFKFVVDYHRVGYTHLYDVQQVSVRPLQHTQYERFIPSAYPYYASSFSMMFGVFIFAFVFLYHKDQSAPGIAATKSGKKD